MSAHHDVFEIMFFAFLAWIVGSIIYKAVKYGGLAASGLRAPVERTVGRFSMDNGTQVEVQQLGGSSPERAIGIVLKRAGMPILAFATSVAEAQKLAVLMELVAGRDDPPHG